MIGQDDFGRAIKECVIRWPTLEKQLDVYYSHLSFINYEAFSDICQRFVEDFRSMPLPKDFKEAYGDWKKENWERDPELSDRPGYKIQMGANCRKCGKKNIMCIEEPLGSEYECRPCYTGLTDRELISKFSELIEMLGGKFKYSEVKYVKDRGLAGDRVLKVDPIKEMIRVKELKGQTARLLAEQNEKKDNDSDDVRPF